MKLDDLKEELRACHARADGSLGVRGGRVREDGLRATGGAMRRLQAYLWLELGLNALAALGLGDFLASHHELRFMVPGLVLDACAIAHVVFGARQLVGIRRLDFGGPVVAVQRELETLRIGRIGMTKWTLLLAPLLWVPLLVVVLEGLFGVDAYAVLDRGWLVANALFGVAFVPVMLAVAKRLADRVEGSPVLRRLLRDLAGANLSAAQGFVDELARFEAEERG